MSNESHPSPTGSSSSSLYGGGGGVGNNTISASGPSDSSPSRPTFAQILNSSGNTPSSTSGSSAATVNTAAFTSITGNNTGGGAIGSSPVSSSPSSQHSVNTNSARGATNTQMPGTASTTTSISPSQIINSASGAFNFSGPRNTIMSNVYDHHQQQQQQQQSQMSWPSNSNHPSPWIGNRAASIPQSLDSNQNIPGGRDGFDRPDSSSPTPDWSKPVTTNNSSSNGWLNFQPQKQQQTMNNPSRSNTVGNSNTSSNQWPEMNNFYSANPSTGIPFNLPQNNNDNMNNNSASTTWQELSSTSGNNDDTLILAASGGNSSVINKHKSSSSASIAASVSSALNLPGGNPDAAATYPLQPKLVEQLGWDEPDINVIKRANFDDGTSIWGDPVDVMSVPVKKWTNGAKSALSNSTNTMSQQSSAVQKVPASNIQSSSAAASASQVGLSDENWPKQQSPTVPQQSASQWNDGNITNEQGPSQVVSQQPTNYRNQQLSQGAWNAQPQQGTLHGSDDWFRDGMVDTSDWGLQGSQNKVPFDPYEGQVDTSSWGVQGGGGGGGGNPMGGPLSMPPINRNRFMNDYDMSESPHDPHSIHRVSSFENASMSDQYRQGSDLKNPIIGLGGLLPPSNNQQPPHPMLPPSQLSFAPRPGPFYQQPGSILRPINPNGIPTQSGAIMGTGGLISPKLSTTSPVPNQAPYVPSAAKQGNMSGTSSQTPVPQQQTQQQQGIGSINNGAVQAQIMQQFRLAVQAGLISQDLLNTKLPPFMLQLLQKLFELQQKYQTLTCQCAELSKHKQRFPVTVFQTEHERLSKAILQRKQDMLAVQKQIQDAHTKLIQTQSSTATPTPSQMMSNGPIGQGQPPPGVSTSAYEQLGERMQHSLNVDQSRLSQWTKQSLTRGAQSSASMFGPPGLTQKDWQTSGNNPSEAWENPQATDSNTNSQVGNIDSHANSNQITSTFGDSLADFGEDTDGPPEFVPGQMWQWKSSMPNAEEDPHVTPSSLAIGPKGSASSMNNLNVGANDSAFSHPQSIHHMQRTQIGNRSQWHSSLHDQQGFQPSMNDWVKPQQYRGTQKQPPTLNHQPSHASFGTYRPYM